MFIFYPNSIKDGNYLCNILYHLIFLRIFITCITFFSKLLPGYLGLKYLVIYYSKQKIDFLIIKIRLQNKYLETNSKSVIKN